MRLFCELVVAARMFHTINLAHLDLKPANILMDENVNAVVGSLHSLIAIFFNLSFIYKSPFYQLISGSRGTSYRRVVLVLLPLLEQCCTYLPKWLRTISVNLYKLPFLNSFFCL
jgi:serine/threonine protein kinase